jgi:hypothetical protein
MFNTTKVDGWDPPTTWQHCSGELAKDYCKYVLTMVVAGHRVVTMWKTMTTGREVEGRF